MITTVNLLRSTDILALITRYTMYVRRYIVVRRRNHCCHENGKKRSLLIVVSVGVAVNNIKVFSVGTEMRQWLSIALLSSYKIFLTAGNNKSVPSSSCKFPDIFIRF